jgi:hypothetical protein
MEIDQIKNGIIYSSAAMALLRKRQLKELVSPNSTKFVIDEPIFICDTEKVHGVIILNRPQSLNKDLFNNHFSRHLITEEFKELVWPNIKKFNTYTFRIKKVFKDPIDFKTFDKSNLSMSQFLKDIELVDKEKEEFDKKISDYKIRLEKLKELSVIEDDSVLKDLILSLYSLVIERIEEKRHHYIKIK